jgi:hypothetical protein
MTFGEMVLVAGSVFVWFLAGLAGMHLDFSIESRERKIEPGEIWLSMLGPGVLIGAIIVAIGAATHTNKDKP